MTWVILTGRQSDLDQVGDAAQDHYQSRLLSLTRRCFAGARPKVINLSNSYGYQSRGYYASLLAELARPQVIPTVETMIDLSEPKAL